MSEPSPFFPVVPEPAGLVFAWLSLVLLLGLLSAAAYFDLRYLRVPKAVSLTTLALGLIGNMVRGGWLGGTGHDGWLLQSGVGLGILDGLLFSLAGFAFGFGLFFALWLLGLAGGGDVKLFAAVGAWVGPEWALFILIGTIVFVALLSAVQLTYRLVTGGAARTIQEHSMRSGRPRSQQWQPGVRHVPKRRLTGYSLPLALSTAVVLLWVWRAELRHGWFPSRSTAETIALQPASSDRNQP